MRWKKRHSSTSRSDTAPNRHLLLDNGVVLGFLRSRHFARPYLVRNLRRTIALMQGPNAFADSLIDAQVAAVLAYARARYTDRPAWPKLEKTVREARKESTQP